MKYARQIGEKTTTSNIIQHKPLEAIRLNKYIASSGFFSRREADRLIEAGQVYIDGVPAEIGTKVSPHQEVIADGKIISPHQEPIYIALNKPKGITCTTDINIEGNITAFMNHSDRIFPIGRLDKPSTGLLLLTNDGDIVNKILRSVHDHEKEYIVIVDKPITEVALNQISNGVKIYNPVTNQYQTTKKCKVTSNDKKTFQIVLTEGLNRQIRRMCTALGYRVISLKRVRIMNIKLENLSLGEWRYLREEELIQLNKSIKK